MKTTIYKPDLIAAFLAGAIVIKNEIGANDTLKKLLREMIPECFLPLEFKTPFIGYDVTRNEWFGIVPEKDTGQVFEAVPVFDFIDPNEVEVIDTLDRDQIISFEASYHHNSEKSKSFCVSVVKGDDEGKSWSGLVWFPEKYASHTEPLPYGRCIVKAPLWLLQDRGIQYSITLKNTL